MTYKEFKKTYNWSVKQFPDCTCLYSETMNKVIGKCIITEFVKAGKKWIEIGEKEVEEMTAAYYMNSIDAVPFFRGIGGFERVEKAYSKYGLLPFRIHSISPDGKNKTVREYHFA